jgi:hypothetical protein
MQSVFQAAMPGRIHDYFSYHTSDGDNAVAQTCNTLPQVLPAKMLQRKAVPY